MVQDPYVMRCKIVRERIGECIYRIHKIMVGNRDIISILDRVQAYIVWRYQCRWEMESRNSSSNILLKLLKQWLSFGRTTLLRAHSRASTPLLLLFASITTKTHALSLEDSISQSFNFVTSKIKLVWNICEVHLKCL